MARCTYFLYLYTYIIYLCIFNTYLYNTYLYNDVLIHIMIIDNERMNSQKRHRAPISPGQPAVHGRLQRRGHDRRPIPRPHLQDERHLPQDRRQAQLLAEQGARRQQQVHQVRFHGQQGNMQPRSVNFCLFFCRPNQSQQNISRRAEWSPDSPRCTAKFIAIVQLTFSGRLLRDFGLERGRRLPPVLRRPAHLLRPFRVQGQAVPDGQPLHEVPRVRRDGLPSAAAGPESGVGVDGPRPGRDPQREGEEGHRQPARPPALRLRRGAKIQNFKIQSCLLSAESKICTGWAITSGTYISFSYF